MRNSQKVWALVRPGHGALLLAAAVLACVNLAGCGSEKGAPGADARSHEAPAARPAPVAVTVAPAEMRPVQRRIAVVGTLYGYERITVTPKVEGRVLAVHFDVGDRLQPGATLLEIDPTDFRLAADEAQRAVEQELSKLGLSQPPSAEFDIEQLPSVERARLVLENAENRYQRHKQLVARNAVSHELFEQAETDLKIAEVSLRQARLDAKTTLATVRQRQAVFASARQKLDETTVLAPRLPKLPSLDEADHEYAVARRMVSLGEMVRAFPSTPVYELVVDDALKLKVMVPERYLAQVAPGQAVEVRVDAYPGRTFPAHIGRISPAVDSRSRTFEVEADVPNPGHLLKHGGFAKADVIVQAEAQALTVPLEAITTFAGVSKVFRICNDTAEEIVVESGAHGAGWVEAAGSLKPGDLVATSGQSRLADGTKVVVRLSEARAPAAEGAAQQ